MASEGIQKSFEMLLSINISQLNIYCVLTGPHKLTVAPFKVSKDIASAAFSSGRLDKLQRLPALAHLPVRAGAVHHQLYAVQGHGYVRTAGGRGVGELWCSRVRGEWVVESAVSCGVLGLGLVEVRCSDVGLETMINAVARFKAKYFIP